MQDNSETLSLIMIVIMEAAYFNHFFDSWYNKTQVRKRFEIKTR
jgi:hypothetical protein